MNSCSERGILLKSLEYEQHARKKGGLYEIKIADSMILVIYVTHKKLFECLIKPLCV